MKMKSAETHPTPQRVVDAIQIVAAWLCEIDAAEALISPEGGAAFHATHYAADLLDGWEGARAWARQWKAAAHWWRRLALDADRVVDAVRDALGDCDEPTWTLQSALKAYEERRADES